MGTQSNDLTMVQRVTAAYRHSARIHQNLGQSMWQMFFDTRHQSLHKLFLTGNLNQAAEVLHNPHTSDLFYGFDNLTVSILPCFAEPTAQQNQATLCLDHLVRFAEAIGAIPLDNPEHHFYIPPFPWQADAVIDKINKILGIQIVFPNPYPHEVGLLTSCGVMSYRVPQALYQACRLKQLVQGIPHPRILEIGAGLGRTAYYARLLGIKDYTIVDIPFTAISSGYFLGRTLGEGQILLSGETAPDSQERIKILTPAEFLASYETYDVILNADGFTEMDPAIARSYLRRIEKAAPLLLSINHEANAYTVKMLIAESSNIADVARYPYWIRQGYLEEVIRFK